MARIDISGSIGSLVGFYKHERSIFGRCPHCGEPFRLSEVKLTYGKEPPKDLGGVADTAMADLLNSSIQQA
jgi:hypothetical protein